MTGDELTEGHKNYLRFRRPAWCAALTARAMATPLERRGWFCLQELCDVALADASACNRIREISRRKIELGEAQAVCLDPSPYAPFRLDPESAVDPDLFALAVERLWISRAASRDVIKGAGIAVPDWLAADLPETGKGARSIPMEAAPVSKAKYLNNNNFAAFVAAYHASADAAGNTRSLTGARDYALAEGYKGARQVIDMLYRPLAPGRPRKGESQY